MTTHRVRCFYENGMVEVSSGSGEARTSIIDASVDNAAAATDIANAALADFAYSPRESITPKVNDTPSWPTTGDAISTFDGTGSLATNRLVTRRVNIDAEGHADLVPTLASPSELYEKRQARRIESVTRKSMNGRYAATGKPFIDGGDDRVLSGTMSAPGVPPWTIAPLDEHTAGPEWECNEYTLLTKVTVSLRATTGEPPPLKTIPATMRVLVYIDYTLITFIDVPPATWDYKKIGLIPIAPGQKMLCAVGEIGGPPPSYNDLNEINCTIQFDSAYGSLNRNARVN